MRQSVRELRAQYGNDAALIEAAMAVIDAKLRARKRPGGAAWTDHAAVGMMIGQYAHLMIAGENREHFLVAFLDARHRLLEIEPMFLGTIDQCTVHARPIVQRAMQLNAAAIIVAHNHPSGETQPSTADRIMTKKLKEALETVDVRLLDHFVVGEGKPASMHAMGLI